MVETFSLNFSVFTVKLVGVRKFRNFTVILTVDCNICLNKNMWLSAIFTHFYFISNQVHVFAYFQLLFSHFLSYTHNIGFYGDLTKFSFNYQQMSRVMRKPTFCICENKDADQLRGNRKADQRLCFRYIDSPIPLLSKSEISSL